MLTWLKILCAVDFSESSRAAVEHAADLARRFDAELTLIHVREAPREPEGQRVAARELPAAQARELGDKLQAWRAEAERLAGRPVRALLEGGAPVTEIVAEARNGHHDLVVTGTHGRKGLRHVFLPSVAEQVVREAPCPVLVARPPPDWGD